MPAPLLTTARIPRGGGGGGGLVYGNWLSTAPKAGHGTDLRLTFCAPPHAYSLATWVYDTLPGRPDYVYSDSPGISTRLSVPPGLKSWHCVHGGIAL